MCKIGLNSRTMWLLEHCQVQPWRPLNTSGAPWIMPRFARPSLWPVGLVGWELPGAALGLLCLAWETLLPLTPQRKLTQLSPPLSDVQCHRKQANGFFISQGTLYLAPWGLRRAAKKESKKKKKPNLGIHFPEVSLLGSFVGSLLGSRCHRMQV